MAADGWGISVQELLHRLNTSETGLSENEARARLPAAAQQRIRATGEHYTVALLLRQFMTPIVLVLILAASLSFALGDVVDGTIVLTIIFASGLLGFWQEHGAANIVRDLLAMVQVSATVKRDGRRREIAIDELVPGDVIELTAGSAIPADCRLIEATDLFVDEAALTGESLPVSKSTLHDGDASGYDGVQTHSGAAAAVRSLSRQAQPASESLFMGTHVVSGHAWAVVVRVGKQTAFGEVAQRLRLRAPENEFEHGIRRFGQFLLELTLLLTLFILLINLALGRPMLDAFMFALALAVGLTPQLLPAVVSVAMARGARRMADRRVIVRKLTTIETFGSLDVLCCDKTGTLTTGHVTLRESLGVNGQHSDEVRRLACINAMLETGFVNPIDESLRQIGSDVITAGIDRLDEVPYDFIRKRLTIVIADPYNDGDMMMITKGAVPQILDLCVDAEIEPGRRVSIDDVRTRIDELVAKCSAKGWRILAVAIKRIRSGALSSQVHGSADQARRDITAADEYGMTYVGLLAFSDPLKPGSREAIARMVESGVRLKVISGDNVHVVASVASEIGVTAADGNVLTGRDLQTMRDDALAAAAHDVDVFAEIEPNQKERIILALRRSGATVGFLGDGINDATAMHSADVSISVADAADVAKEAADIVLLEKDLGVLMDGVHEGRKTFANTLKYVFMATSANFGNMFSVAGASLFLPFLPLLPKQILFMNLLTDMPEMAIAGDTVDPELVEKPRRWDIRFIRRFMLVFGLLSSVFDYLTFLVLLSVLGAAAPAFRTGWFIESAASAALIVLVIRTRRPIWKSAPAKALGVLTLLVVIAAMAIPYTPLNALLGFTPLPWTIVALILAIVAVYVLTAELVKRQFYRIIG